MGWGTFIAGRLLRTRTSGADPLGDWKRNKKIVDNLAEDRLFLEKEVLKAITVLKSQGAKSEIIDRRELYKSLKFYYKKKSDPRFKLNVVRQAQAKVLQGEEADLDYLELIEIRRLYKRNQAFSVSEISLWLILPYYQLWKLMRNQAKK